MATGVKETIRVGALELRMLLDGDDTNQTMTVFEFELPPGARGPAPHYHEAVDELVVVLRGTATTRVGEQTRTLAPGASCFIPRGMVHHHSNPDAEPLVLLTVMTPATIGPVYFREMAALLAAGGPPDPAQAQEIMARHGLVVAA